jgi:hypothetical protein
MKDFINRISQVSSIGILLLATSLQAKELPVQELREILKQYSQLTETDEAQKIKNKPKIIEYNKRYESFFCQKIEPKEKFSKRCISRFSLEKGHKFILTQISRDSYQFSIPGLYSLFSVTAYNSNSSHPDLQISDKLAEKIEEGNIGSTFTGEFDLITDWYPSNDSFPNFAFEIAIKFSSIQKQNDRAITEMSEAKLIELAKLLYEAKVLIDDADKPIQGKKFEIKGNALLKEIQSLGLLRMPSENRLFLAGKNADETHLWFTVSLPDIPDGFVAFHGDYTSSAYKEGTYFDHAFFIEEFSLGKFTADSKDFRLNIEITIVPVGEEEGE